MRCAQDIGRVSLYRIGIGRPHQGLRREMEDELRGKLTHGAIEGIAVANISANIFDGLGNARCFKEARGCRGIQTIAPDDCALAGKPEREPAAFESGVAGKKNADTLPRAGHHVFHGARPEAQSSSSSCLSRSVSMGCQ